MENSKDVKFTKGYWRKNAKSNQLETAYMLSELVDNSLSSWLVNHDNNADGCYVEIAYVVEDVKGETVEKLVISDNAYGVNENQIEKILTPGADNEKETKLNVYGFGLKDAAFWSGQTLTFKTKTVNNDYATDSEITLKGESDEKPQIVTTFLKGDDANIVFLKDGESTYEDHGTQVTLSDLYKLRNFDKLAERISSLSENGLDDKNVRKSNEITFSLLAYKYKRYIEDGMRINFLYVNRINPEENASFEFNAEKVDDYVRSTFLKEIPKTHLQQVLLVVNENKKPGENDITYVEAVREVVNNAKDFENSNVAENRDEYIRILNSDNEPIQESYSFDLDDVKDNEITLGYLSSSESRWRGLYLYQFNRAICTGPNKTGEDYNSTFNIYTNSETIRDNHMFKRRLWGEMDIDKLVNDQDMLVLNTNKRGINKDESLKYDEFLQQVKMKANMFMAKWAPLVASIEEWGKRKNHAMTGLKSSDEEKNTVLKTIVQYNGKSIEEVGILNEDDFLQKNNDINSLKISDKALLKFVFKGINGGDDEDSSILFSIDEAQGAAEDYPFSYSTKMTNDGIKYYQIYMNTNSNLLMPLWEKGSLKENKQEFIKTKITEVYYKLAIAETIYDIFCQYKNEDEVPLWVDKLRTFAEASDDTSDYTKEVKDAISAMLAGADF